MSRVMHSGTIFTYLYTYASSRSFSRWALSLANSARYSCCWSRLSLSCFRGTHGARAVGGVGFADVDEEKLDSVLVFLVHVVQDASLASEGRSRVGPKNQGHRLLALVVAERDRLFAVGALESKVRCSISLFQLIC